MKNYNELDKVVFRKMLEEILDKGEETMLWQNAEIDWNLPNDNKVCIKRYRIHIGIEDG